MLNRLFSFGLVLITFAAWTRHAEGSYEHDKVVRLEPLTDAHIDYLRALEDTTLDFWTEIIGVNKPVDVHIAANEYDQYISQFKQYSLPFEVLVDDLQVVIDKERDELLQDQFMRQMRSRLLGQARADIVGTYASYADMVTFLKEKAAADPSRVEVIVLGNTFENRQIQAAVLKYNPSAKKNVWIDCGIHAREWITPATCIWIVDKLIEEYNTDSTVRDLLDYWNVYVAPSLNPDGYEYSRIAGNRMWRKSRSKYATSTCYGVDLNRNYPWKWMTGGASTSACSDTYGGSAAGSEIETISVVNFMQSKIGTWDMYMSFHSYGQWWFTPYGYTTDLPADYNEQMRVAQIGANAIKAVNQRDYTLGTVSRLLYIASGSTTDWAYDALKIKFSYTIELPPTQRESSTGFVLPPAQAPGVCRETYAGMKAFMAEVKKAVVATSSG